VGRCLRARRLGVVSFSIAALSQSACFGGSDRPARLVDGSPTKRPSVALEGVGSPQVETRASAVGLRAAVPESVARCLAATRDHPPRPPVVARIGVDGASVTYRTASGRDLVACDGTAVRVRPSRPWCGRALGRMHAGRLLDPRLDLAACSTASGDIVAFVWVEPARRARYVAVDRHGFVEVYPVVGRLPVRIATTSDLDLDSSSASFPISEHDADGRLLRSYTLRARVAG
jgi:hypothetical protein